MFASTGRLVLKRRSCLLEAAGKINARHAMTKPEIIGSIRSTYTRVVCMVCEEKGIEYVLTETPLRAPEIFAIHPFGKMPVLRHGDFVLFESKAIADYLDRSFPVPYVFPSEARLAYRTMGFTCQHTNRPHLHPDLSLRVYRVEDGRWRT